MWVRENESHLVDSFWHFGANRIGPTSTKLGNGALKVAAESGSLFPVSKHTDRLFSSANITNGKLAQGTWTNSVVQCVRRFLFGSKICRMGLDRCSKSDEPHAIQARFQLRRDPSAIDWNLPLGKRKHNLGSLRVSAQKWNQKAHQIGFGPSFNFGLVIRLVMSIKNWNKQVAFILVEDKDVLLYVDRVWATQLEPNHYHSFPIGWSTFCYRDVRRKRVCQGPVDQIRHPLHLDFWP